MWKALSCDGSIIRHVGIWNMGNAGNAANKSHGLSIRVTRVRDRGLNKILGIT